MNEKHKKGFYFVLSAAAAAGVTVPVRDAVAQVCGCAPAKLTKTMPGNFVLVSTGAYAAELVVDNWYGFINSVAPQVWLDWSPSSTTATWWTYSLCRDSWDETQVLCGTSGSVQTTATTHKEKAVPVTGANGNVYGTNNTLWDRYRLNLWSSVSAVTPKKPAIPIVVSQSW